MNHENENDDVHLICMKIGGKLRIRITSKGYKNEDNWRFPRAIRKEGTRYSVKASNINLIKRGKSYFYAVNFNGGVILKDEVKNMIDKVYNTEDESSECCICLCEEKDSVFNPCGHYVACESCAFELKKCPICRIEVLSVIGFDQLS